MVSASIQIQIIGGFEGIGQHLAIMQRIGSA
jgi:hypothetical protein